MTHVALHAYPFGNVGDDLFIQTICQRYPDVQFHLAMNNTYANAFSSTSNLTIHPSGSVFNRLKKRTNRIPFPRAVGKKIGATVYIGGSLFIEQPGWERAFSEMGKLHLSARPYFIIGANFGPYRSAAFLDHHRAFFTNITDVCFRDRYSHALFEDIPHVRYAPDVLFSLHKSLEENRAPNGRKHVLLSVIYPSIRADLVGVDEQYFKAMAHVAAEALKKDYTVTISAFCPYEKDDVAVEEIMRRIPADQRDGINIHTYDGDMEAVFLLFQQATHIVATRFHAVVLGWLFEKHVLPVSYSKKMDNMLSDIGYEGVVQQVEDIRAEQCASFIGSQQPRVRVEALALAAEAQFERLDTFLAEARITI